MSNQELAGLVSARLQTHSWRIATAESCTGGGLAAALTDLPGSSAWFECGFVTYSNHAKQAMLGVLDTTLQAHGAVSEATVREMAQGALHHSQANVACAVSGIAGPGGATADKPVGLVCFAWALEDGRVHVETRHFAGDREQIRTGAVAHALRMLAGIPS